ncbi:hypothetical protein EDB83DRAFT_2511914 [Lactarius deliciosus]|nr:hypothetical protein EDB83DRAFT_2511914 [Lactarius deliciosus]
MDHTSLSGIMQEEFKKNVEAAIQTLPSSRSQSPPLPSSSSSSGSSSPSINLNLSTVNCLPANPIPIPSPTLSLCQSLHAGEEPATLLALPSIDAWRLLQRMEDSLSKPEALDGTEEAIVSQFTLPQTPATTLLKSSAQDPSILQAPYKPWVRHNSPSPSPSAQTLVLPQNSYSTSRTGTAGLDIPGLQAEIDAAHTCAADAACGTLIQIFPTVDQEVIEWQDKHDRTVTAQPGRDPEDGDYDPQRENEVRAATAVLERLLGAWEYETDHVQTARAVSSYTPHPSMRYQEPWE